MFFVEGADDGHFDIGRVPGRADHVESAFARGFQVEFPFTDAGGDDDARNPAFKVIGVDEIAVGTVLEMFITKHDIK